MCHLTDLAKIFFAFIAAFVCLDLDLLLLLHSTNWIEP